MVKKYTMQDIADAANVSKATVSYVLNDKSGARVSEETRRKVLQIANVFHYVPNLSAKYLGDTRKKLMGIVVGGDSMYDSLSGFRTIDMLYGVFPSSDYKMVLLDSKRHYEYFDLAYDIIFARDLSEAQISDMSKNTFSPMVLLDCAYSDSLFFHILNDYRAALKCAESKFRVSRACALLYSARNNETTDASLKELPAAETFALRPDNRAQADEFLKRNRDKNIVALDEIAGLYALSACERERLAVLVSDGGEFPDGVIKIYWDEERRKEHVRALVAKFEAREAENEDEHILWVPPICE